MPSKSWSLRNTVSNSSKNTILFDLGNTLVQYYSRSEFPDVLEQAMSEVQTYLEQEGLLKIPPETVRQGVQDENREAWDYRVRPLEERLFRIFGLGDPAKSENLADALCRCFTKPIFALGRIYDDSLPVLQNLRSKGFKTAIVSNSPWGSPPYLWREELDRLGLSPHVSEIVLCGDVGWRKPERRIFEFTLEKLQARPEHCVFVGDDPRWDLVGPREVGIEAVLIDRQGTMQDSNERFINTLYELLDWPGLLK